MPAAGTPQPGGTERSGTRPRALPGVRAAIFASIGLTVVIWIVVGAVFGRRLATVEAEAEALSQRFLRAQPLLSEARQQVMLSAVFLREAINRPEETFGGASRVRVLEALDITEQNLQSYVPVLDEVHERAEVLRLLDAVAQLRRQAENALSGDAVRTEIPRSGALPVELQQQPEELVRRAEALGRANRQAFVDRQARSTALLGNIQRQFTWVVGLATLVSLGIAAGGAIYIGRLERHLDEQRRRDQDQQDQLHRLSGTLIRVREEERRSIARDLHDEVGQLLTATKVRLSSAGRLLEAGAAAQDPLRDGIGILDQALQSVRDLSRLLHPPLIDDLGLQAAVEWQVSECRERDRLEVNLTCDGLTGRLAPDMELAAYRVVQEALTNVSRHAQASHVVVRVTRRPDELSVVIQDDGRGFDTTARATRGVGLVSMRERVAQLGGVVTIASEPGRGTRVAAHVPLGRGDAAQSSEERTDT